jgi:hypothetical protein
MTTETTRENRLRRMAKRQGLYITKSRTSDGYMLVDANINCIVAGGSPIPYNLSLDDVESYLREEG